MLRDDDQLHRTLLAAVALGDDAALGQLYDRFERPLYALGVRMLHDKQRAEDVVQETIVKVWRSAASFDPSKGAVSPWVFSIARRTAIDALRREKRAAIPVDPTAHDVGVPEDEAPDWTAWEVGLALAALPQDQRQVVELCVVLGYTHAEAAEALAIPLGTVKTRVYAGLRRLRERFEKLEITEGAS